MNKCTGAKFNTLTLQGNANEPLLKFQLAPSECLSSKRCVTRNAGAEAGAKGTQLNYWEERSQYGTLRTFLKKPTVRRPYDLYHL